MSRALHAAVLKTRSTGKRKRIRSPSLSSRSGYSSFDEDRTKKVKSIVHKPNKKQDRNDHDNDVLDLQIEEGEIDVYDNDEKEDENYNHDDEESFLENMNSNEQNIVENSNENQNDEANDDPFESESKYIEEESLGHEVSEKLANIVNDRFSKPQNKIGFKKRMEDIAKPKNCKELRVPSVNKTIKKRLDTNSYKKKEESTFYTIQKAIVKSASAITAVMNDFSVSNPKLTNKERNRLCMNSISLLGGASYELSLIRRDNLKQFAGVLYKHVKDTEVCPIDDNLFGSDMAASSEKAKKLNKIYQPQSFDMPGTSRATHNSSYSHAPSTRGRGRGGRKQSGSSRPFLGQGQGHQYHNNKTKKKPYFPFNSRK